MKVCSFDTVFSVILHVSEPKSSTGLTFEFNILILVPVVISLDLQMFPTILNVLRAFPILGSTSSSVPPVMFITLPKYVKDVTSSMSRLAILQGCK